MPRRGPGPKKRSETSRWRTAAVDTRAEHFELAHEAAPTRTIAVVGRGKTEELTLSYVNDALPDGLEASRVRKQVEAELDFWCRPDPDDEWHLIDLWFLLGEHAASDANQRARVRWTRVASSEHDDEGSRYVDRITRLAEAWMRLAWRDRNRSDPSMVAEARNQVRFVCDYVSVMAVGEDPEQLTLGRLRRLVRLQGDGDPSARFELSFFGDDYEDTRVRIERFADLDFVDAHAVSDYEGFVVSKLARNGTSAPEPWSRGEVRKLLQHVAGDFELHGTAVDLMADAEGPHVLVRFDVGELD